MTLTLFHRIGTEPPYCKETIITDSIVMGKLVDTTRERYSIKPPTTGTILRKRMASTFDCPSEMEMFTFMTNYLAQQMFRGTQSLLFTSPSHLSGLTTHPFTNKQQQGEKAAVSGKTAYKCMASALTLSYTWRHLQSHFINNLQNDWHEMLERMVRIHIYSIFSLFGY